MSRRVVVGIATVPPESQASGYTRFELRNPGQSALPTTPEEIKRDRDIINGVDARQRALGATRVMAAMALVTAVTVGAFDAYEEKRASDSKPLPPIEHYQEQYGDPQIQIRERPFHGQNPSNPDQLYGRR